MHLQEGGHSFGARLLVGADCSLYERKPTSRNRSLTPTMGQGLGAKAVPSHLWLQRPVLQAADPELLEVPQLGVPKLGVLDPHANGLAMWMPRQ